MSLKSLNKVLAWRDGVAEVDVALLRQRNEALQVVGFFNGVGLAPVRPMFAVIFRCVQVTVHAPNLSGKFQEYLFLWYSNSSNCESELRTSTYKPG